MQITVPESWADIRLSTYQQLSAVDRLGLSEFDAMVQRVSILTGADIRELRTLSTAEFEALGGHLLWMAESPPSEFDRVITVEGVELGLEPMIHEIKVGAWADIEHHITEGSIDNLHHILSVLYRPITSKSDSGYQIEPYDGTSALSRAEAIAEEVTVAQVHGASLFFCLLASNYMRLTAHSS